MDREPDHAVIDAMLTMGGSFVQQLALAFRAADPVNQERLKAAFADEWERYAELARRANQATMNPNVMTKTVRLYEDSKGAGVCRGCGAPMDWYDTLNGKKMPMNAGAVPLKSENEPDTQRVIAYFAAEDSHWNSCPERQQFSRITSNRRARRSPDGQ